jgi:hypothetical protein
MLRIDFILSYWIFFWYLLYVFNWTPYSPKFALILGTIENLIILAFMFVYNTRPRFIVLFAIMVFLIKILPLYFIWNKKIQKQDIFATVGLFVIYGLWTQINGKNPTEFLDKTKDLVLHNKNTLPGMMVLDRISRYVL